MVRKIERRENQPFYESSVPPDYRELEWLRTESNVDSVAQLHASNPPTV